MRNDQEYRRSLLDLYQVNSFSNLFYLHFPCTAANLTTHSKLSYQPQLPLIHQFFESLVKHNPQTTRSKKSIPAHNQKAFAGRTPQTVNRVYPMHNATERPASMRPRRTYPINRTSTYYRTRCTRRTSSSVRLRSSSAPGCS